MQVNRSKNVNTKAASIVKSSRSVRLQNSILIRVSYLFPNKTEGDSRHVWHGEDGTGFIDLGSRDTLWDAIQVSLNQQNFFPYQKSILTNISELYCTGACCKKIYV